MRVLSKGNAVVPLVAPAVAGSSSIQGVNGEPEHVETAIKDSSDSCTENALPTSIEAATARIAELERELGEERRKAAEAAVTAGKHVKHQQYMRELFQKRLAKSFADNNIAKRKADALRAAVREAACVALAAASAAASACATAEAWQQQAEAACS